MLASAICNIHFACVEQIIDKLEFIEKSLKNHEHFSDTKEKQPLMMSINDSEDGYCIIDRNLTGPGVSVNSNDNLQFIYLNLIEVTNDGLNTVLLFVNCASESFCLPFKLRPVYHKSKEIECDTVSRQSSVMYEPNNKVEIIQAEEKLFLYFKGLSRLSDFLNQKVAR